MKAIVAGDDRDGLGGALAAAGVEVVRLDGVATRPALEEAGVHDVDLFVLTDVGQATAIPIARDLAEDLRVVVYADEALPEFVSASRVVRIDPGLLDPDAVAEELAE